MDYWSAEMVRLFCNTFAAVGYTNGNVRLVDALSLDDLQGDPFCYSRDAVTHIAFSHDRRYMATAVSDRKGSFSCIFAYAFEFLPIASVNENLFSPLIFPRPYSYYIEIQM